MGLRVQADHVHMVCSIPPKLCLSEYMGLLKGKLTIKLFKTYLNLKQQPYRGNHFWSRGHFVSTVCIDEEMIMRYLKFQEHESVSGNIVGLCFKPEIKATFLAGDCLLMLYLMLRRF